MEVTGPPHSPIAPFQETKPQPNIRQQAELIRELLPGVRQTGGDIEVSAQERQVFLEKVKRDEIGDAQFTKLLRDIHSPIQQEPDGQNPTELFGRVQGLLEQHKHMGTFLNLLVGKTSFDDSVASDVTRFHELYPDPIAFLPKVEQYIHMIGTGYASKVAAYEEFFRNFMQVMYGKRYEYWEQIELLKDEAKGPALKSGGEQADTVLIDEFERFSLEDIPPDEAQRILETVAIHGDEFHGKMFTKDMIIQEGLLPKYRTRIGNTVIWFSSSPYDLTHGRIAVMAYVQTDKGIVARSYYRSNSQGVWRYLPRYAEIEGILDWYEKGYGEESITLPILLQRALAEITERNPQALTVSDPEFLFAGTARKISTNRDGTMYHEVNEESARLAGNFYTNGPSYPLKRVPPEQIRFTNPRQSPDFSNMLASWKQRTSLYGQIEIEVYASKDEQFKYMFCRDNKGRAWIAGVEDNSRVQSTGLRKQWVNAGDLTTPSFEYKTTKHDQTGGYGNEEMRGGTRNEYVDMYKTYLSKILPIQEYQQHKRTEGSEEKTEVLGTLD